jgi:hypothetical protein
MKSKKYSAWTPAKQGALKGQLLCMQKVGKAAKRFTQFVSKNREVRYEIG